MISLRQLRYFEALMRHRHFGRAAEDCAISQPALSMQIRELEASLGTALVERRRDGVFLTKSGAEFVGRAEAILAAVADLETLARRERAPLSGVFRLGCIPSIAPYLLPQLLPEIRLRHREARLVLRETKTASLVEELRAGDLDAILVSVPLDEPDLSELSIFEDAFLLAVPAQSPHAACRIASEDLLDSENLLLLEDGHCFRDQVLAACQRIEVRGLKNFGVTSLSTLLQLVADGQGLTLLPELFVEAGADRDPRVRLLRFASPGPRRTIGLAWRRSSAVERDVAALAAAVKACREAKSEPALLHQSS
jgi:LysR family hydrogen peroxide-inducible transcriptional activator